MIDSYIVLDTVRVMGLQSSHKIPALKLFSYLKRAGALQTAAADITKHKEYQIIRLHSADYTVSVFEVLRPAEYVCAMPCYSMPPGCIPRYAMLSSKHLFCCVTWQLVDPLTRSSA